MPCTNNVVIRNPQDQASSRQLWRIDHEAKRRGHSFNSCNTRLTKGLASAAINMLSSADASAHELILEWLPTKGTEGDSRQQRTVKRAENGSPELKRPGSCPTSHQTHLCDVTHTIGVVVIPQRLTIKTLGLVH